MQDYVVAGAHIGTNGRTDGRHAGCEGDGRFALLGVGEHLFEQALIGVVQTLVDVNRVDAIAVEGRISKLAEAFGASLGALESEGNRRRNGGKDVIREVPLLATELAVDQDRSVVV